MLNHGDQFVQMGIGGGVIEEEGGDVQVFGERHFCLVLLRALEQGSIDVEDEKFSRTQ